MRSTTSRPPAVATESPVGNRPRLDRILIHLGCEPAFIADLLGDLREECANRSAAHHQFAARLWCAREFLRSTPHLAWNAARKGTSVARARLAAYLLACIATLAVATIAWMTRSGPPARLVSGAASSDGIVVNHTGPVRLSMEVLDAAGHTLRREGVHYKRLSGIPIPISARGIAKCTQRGVAKVRAMLGDLTTDFLIDCEPVREIRFAGWDNFLVGDSAHALTVDAIGLDGEPVTRVAAKLSVADSTVATLDGSLLRPLKPGSTSIEMEIGNSVVEANVTVFERLRSLSELRPDQRWVAVPVHLAPGESVRWPLPTGLFFLAISTDTTAVPVTKASGSARNAGFNVRMTIDGPVMCMPEPETGVSSTHCLARGPGATLTIRHAGRRTADVVAMLALERQEQR